MHTRLVGCFFLTTAAAVVSLSAQESKPAAGQMGWTGVLGEAEFAALHELPKGEAPRLHGEMIEVGEAKAYLSLPQGSKPTAAVLVIHEWWGLNDHVKHWADRLAADGYAALAIDLYGGVVATTREEALAAMNAVDASAALAKLRAAHAFLATDPRVAARKRACIGWCFGGGWSLELAMAAPDLDAAVVYYGRLVTDPDKLAGIRAPLLGVFGDRDRGIPPESVNDFEKAMQKAGKSVRILRYAADHAFANPSSARYSTTHAAAAWREVRVFLRQHLTTEQQTGTFVAGGAKITYQVPSGWQDAGARPMREVNLKVAEGVECYVSVLNGDGGGIEANLNRWRSQMGNEPLSADGIAELPRLDVIGEPSPLLSVEGTYKGMRDETIADARMLATVRSLDGATVFVKLLGPKKSVDAHEAAFRTFCKSMQVQK